MIEITDVEVLRIIPIISFFREQIGIAEKQKAKDEKVDNNTCRHGERICVPRYFRSQEDAIGEKIHSQSQRGGKNRYDERRKMEREGSRRDKSSSETKDEEAKKKKKSDLRRR
ncbi:MULTISPECIES: hypothetical protein [unclassified Rhizobium]|uniref:hypothetical protein n=1 Tax=unclassified Rhizobium TaxID=2613769 RepID=UPI00380C3C77